MTWEFGLSGEVCVLADRGDLGKIRAEAVAAQCGSENLAMFFLGRPTMFAGALAEATDDVLVEVADNELRHS